MVVYFVRVLVEAAKSVYLVVAAVGDGSVHETSRPLSQGSGNLGSVSIDDRPRLRGRVGHDVSVV
jgi:hypothetical protein